ncbi:MAG TPA: hypothetical protein VM221_03675 [Armatimonadota bacterium]|nr:hypothetical protein [Armatimonadota bacterium]
MALVVLTDTCNLSCQACLHRNPGAAAVRALDEFLGAMKADGIEFMTMRDFAAQW